MSDLIDRQAALDGKILIHRANGVEIYSDEAVPVEYLKSLPTIQPHLIAKIQNGIKATNTNDVYSCGMRNGMRWCISLIDDKEPLYENCPPVQPERQKGEWIDYTEDGYVECTFCHSATNCDGNKDELHFCFSCGADMRGEQDETD